MGNRFAEIAFTKSVRAAQLRMNSRDAMDAMTSGDRYHHILGDNETTFIRERDSFYMASTGDGGWPYVQHRGGPAGFVRVLDEKTLAWPDFRGNLQYISLGNLSQDKRACLFFMDYANRIRLKLFGRVTISEDADLLLKFTLPGYKARIERAMLIDVEAFDWNCPQHIVPRYSIEVIEDATAMLRTRISELESRLARYEQPSNSNEAKR